ncbi:alkylmercury lyase-like protein [Kribbella sp. VKM Ac-2571]|uniref:alkylmercury lyase family protein n=1 Tax=Kribbella sp. VKM Ac-2571 TaxID=2512222 RepID=UPI00105F53A5|nr:alkylmercury lyase family protein [Kribbella sp. VKM Ac-2571]TDO56699.1 alkylmercury lyase-like protein [Kribbella sp. VKM Ac-2571]
MKLEVLHVPDCPNLAPMLQRLTEASDLPVTTRLIETDANAAEFGMAGSPTLLIDGVDPFAAGDDCGCGCGVSCRLYRDRDGRIVPAPSVEQLRAAIGAAGQPHDTTAPGEVLSAWRTRALPLDPTEKAVQQAILRAFATTGRPPTPGDLDALTADSGRGTTEILTALHDVDAIQLAANGDIALAYPFSATPTRHRVRIDDRVDIYAMCAIDALGIAAMLDQDTRIESFDVTTGDQVTVTTTAGRAVWEPVGAVVFVGAHAGGGPSADCCCDYLNFFACNAAAQAWTTEHPQVPGQILNQAEAEELGNRLFGHLLTTA